MLGLVRFDGIYKGMINDFRRKSISKDRWKKPKEQFSNEELYFRRNVGRSIDIGLSQLPKKRRHKNQMTSNNESSLCLGQFVFVRIKTATSS